MMDKLCEELLQEIKIIVQNENYRLFNFILYLDNDEPYDSVKLPSMPYVGQRFYLHPNKVLKETLVCKVVEIDVGVRRFSKKDIETSATFDVRLTKDVEYYNEKGAKGK